MEVRGRSCPLTYRYQPEALAQPAHLEADTLYVVGGLYGNPATLRALLKRADREPDVPPAIVFNGDFHWLDVDPEDFRVISETVLAHHAIKGNVEAEFAAVEDGGVVAVPIPTEVVTDLAPVYPAWARAGSRCSTTRPAWSRRPGGTRAPCRWSHAASARPASSGLARSPRPWRRSRQAADPTGPGAHPGPGEELDRRQKCALPTRESLLMQSLVQAFGEEFASHVGRSCPLPRELPLHKIVDWDATAGRFVYDPTYDQKPPDLA